MYMADIVSSPPSTSVITVDDLTPGNIDVSVELPEAPEPTHHPVPHGRWWMFAKFVGVVLVLALLGFNIFAALGGVTDYTASVIRPVMSFFGIKLGNTVKSTVSTAADGGKFALDAAASTVGVAVDALEGKSAKRVREGSKRTLNQIDNAGQRDRKNRARPPPEPDSATSNTQGTPKIRGKGGFCFIGEQENIRSCARVNDPSQCMSGDIFPTEAICVNPSLRQ